MYRLGKQLKSLNPPMWGERGDLGLERRKKNDVI